ncbi:YraN family protein [Gordonia sp. SL306]|uniref:YraN family protein n=1 Tax=Gordonia sp. SL306 TaxID=2995145 RepID=UPI002270FB4A|nr:YraN family protein [Gordonia sp. SL306]WAC55093.1 YraN family protein [Gordonia sp. SL306]
MSDNISRPQRSGTPRRPRSADIGRLGEDLAAEHVQGLGWTVIERNWRNRFGELDLIAADGSVLVVVEVKTRASRIFDDPAAAVTPLKLARMRRLIRHWLADHREGWWGEIRFDVLSVQLDSRDPTAVDRAVVRHHRGVFA